MSPESRGEEIARFLSELIKVDTTNPPGNETEAAKLVRDKLGELGVDSVLVESEPGRGNVVARVKGEEEGPTLLLLSHLDVVPAKPEEWSVDPFSGVIRDGEVWGRGALDCKGPLAVELYVFADIVGRGDFKGTIMFAATADEERGGVKGVGWLVKNRPELVRADYVINEGGGFEIPAEKSLFTVQTAEKGVYWFKLKLKGEPGHASIPGAGRNAVVGAAEAIKRISIHKPRVTPTPHAAGFIKALLDAVGKKWVAKLLLNPLTADRALKKIPDKSQAAFIEAMLRNTLTPTVVKGGYKENVIPSSCEVTVDCRLLPGYGENWVRGYVSKLLKGLDYELEFICREPPTESLIDTPLFKAIRKALAFEVPGSLVSPYISPGGTDSRYFRRAFGSVAYGFIPIRAEVPLKELMRMVHGVNERVSIRNLEFGYRVLIHTLTEFYSMI